MRHVTSLHGPRPVAVVPAFPSYRTQAGRLITLAGIVRPGAVAGFRAAAPSAARKAA